MSVEEKLKKIHKEIIPGMISSHANQLLTATPVASEIMEKMANYLSLQDYNVDTFRRNLQVPFENKPEAGALEDKQKPSATLAYIEKPALFNNPYSISFRDVSNSMFSQARTETEYLADFKTGDILKSSESVELSSDGKYAKSKTITETDYSREGVMTKTESKTYSRRGSYMAEVKKGDFIPDVGYGQLTDANTKYRDENCPFIMHEVDKNGNEEIKLIRLDDLNGLEAQTDDRTGQMYANVLYARLGPDEYARRGINKDKPIEDLANMLGDMPANLETSFSSVKEAMEYVSSPEMEAAIKVMLDHQFYDMQPNAQPFLRDGVDKRGYGNMYKKAFEKYVSRMKEKEKPEKPQTDNQKRKEDGPEFDY